MRGFDPELARAHKQKLAGSGDPSSYNGQRGLFPGGIVRGPGDGTSDQVPDHVPSGTYVMPADSTAKVGEAQLAAMGGGPRGLFPKSGGVPVQLSNGEYKLPPEQVHAIGVQALDSIKEATHTPVARGLTPDGAAWYRGQREGGAKSAVRGLRIAGRQAEAQPPVFFADGGVVEDPRKPSLVNQIPTGGYPPAPPTGAPTQPPAVQNPAVSQIPTGGNPPAPPASGPTGLRIAGAAGAPAPSVATDPQAQSDRAAIGQAWNAVRGVSEDAGRAIADVATMVPRGLVGAYDSAVVRPMRAAGINAGYLSGHLVPNGVDPSSMTPFTDQKRMADNAAAPAAPAPTATAPAGNAGAGRSTDAPMPTSAARSSPQNPGAAAAPITRSLPPRIDPAPEAREVMPGVFRVGNSYGDSAQAAFEGTQTRGLPSRRSEVAAQALSDRYAQQAQGQVQGTIGGVPRELLMQMVARGIDPLAAPTTSVGQSPAEARERETLVRSLMAPLPGMGGALTASQRQGLLELQEQRRRDVQGQANNQTALQQTQMQTGAQTDIATMREQGDAGRAAARNQLDTRRLTLDEQLRGPEIQNAQRLGRLRAQYEAAQTPEARSALARQIRELQGNAQPADWQIQVTPATKNPDGSTSEGSIYRFNRSTGDVQRVDGGQGANLPPIDQNTQALSIRGDKTLTREQKVEALRKLGYSG